MSSGRLSASGFASPWTTSFRPVARKRNFLAQTQSASLCFILNSLADPNGDRSDSTRDPIDFFLQNTAELIQQREPLVFTIKGSKKSTKAQDRGVLRRIEGRPVELSRGRIVMQTTFKYNGATDIAKNWDLDAVAGNLQTILNGVDPTDTVIPKTEWDAQSERPISQDWITSVELESNTKLYKLQWTAGKQRIPRFTSKIIKDFEVTDVGSHDRAKHLALSVDHPIWEAIGIAKMKKIRPKMAAKYRQCQKFVEIVSRLIPQSNQKNISIVDMGCGRGYLTFSLHALMLEQVDHGVAVTTRGIDVRPKLVAEMNAVARDLSMKGLSFECGTIDSFLVQQAANRGNGDEFSIVIALHACDTATDDALWSGLVKNADVLVVAPCCHKQIRPQLDRVRSREPNHPYSDILRHGIYRERLAETVTDTLRALILELSGYDVQVFEFIGGEHTSKNVMITAVKKRKQMGPHMGGKIRDRIKALAQLHGIVDQALAERIGLELDDTDSVRLTSKAISLNGMPSLPRCTPIIPTGRNERKLH